MTTAEKLKERFDGSDATALLEILQMWKDDPDRLLAVFTSGLWSLEPQEAVNGLRRFSANLRTAGDVLGDTEDGRHFVHLGCIVDSYLDLADLLDLGERPDQAIMN